MLDILSQYGRVFLIGQYPDGPLGGLALTFLIAIVALALTFPSAVLVALARTSGIRWLAWSATGFVYLVRSIPLLMVIFWAYFLTPVILGFPTDPVVTLIAAIVIYQTAYLSEVIRGGIEGLPKGQTEAARALGLRWLPITLRVILPQALYNVMPGMLNQLTTIIKESSLGAIISVGEATFMAMRINNVLITKPFQVFVILAAAYFILCFSLSQLSGYLERRIQRSRLGASAP
jgi:polar amino acid transport system permease protein